MQINNLLKSVYQTYQSSHMYLSKKQTSADYRMNFYLLVFVQCNKYDVGLLAILVNGLA